MSSRIHIAVIVAVVAFMSRGVLGATLDGVSPGETDWVAPVEVRCPTFSWTSVDGAVEYELVVYTLPAAAEDPREADPAGAVKVAAHRLPRGATSWTPSLADALEPWVTHAWFVRAVLSEIDGEVVETSEWSVGRYFAVTPPETSSVVIENRQQVSAVEDNEQSATIEDERSLAFMENEAKATPTARAYESVKLRSVATATAAVSGMSLDTVGEVYGVLGTTAAASGAGVAAAHTAGGPDLVLDGSADGTTTTLVRESGIDRPSSATETFSFANSGAGTLNLVVDGAISGNGSGLTGLNAGHLTTGTVPSGRLSGTYAQALHLSNASNSYAGTSASLTGSAAAPNTVLSASNTGSGYGVFGTTAGTGITSFGVYGTATDGNAYAVHGLKTGGSGGLGVYGKNDSGGGSGISGFNGGSGNGTWGFSQDYNGVGGATNRIDNNYGLYTPDNLYSSNYHLAGAIMQVVKNGGAQALELGDVVVIDGVTASPTEGAPPQIRVRKAAEANSNGVLGVVAASYPEEWLTASTNPTGDVTEGTVIPLADGGPIAPGGHLLVVVQGPVRVKASAVAGAIRPGDPLSSAGLQGFASKATTTDSKGFGGALPGTVLGKALEPLNEGRKLIYAFVTLQ